MPPLMIELPLIIVKKGDLPGIMIRKLFTDPKVMNSLVDAALNDRALTVIPTFQNKLRALGSLCEKGIMEKEIDDGGNIDYYFLWS